jgi:hypothetical protein
VLGDVLDDGERSGGIETRAHRTASRRAVCRLIPSASAPRATCRSLAQVPGWHFPGVPVDDVALAVVVRTASRSAFGLAGSRRSVASPS